MSDDQQEAPFLLRIIAGPRAGQSSRVPEDRPLIVGRAPESDFAIPDDGELSALHFSIERIEGACVLRDLGSRNGTRVNRERVREAALREGDEIRAGSTVFCLIRRTTTGPRPQVSPTVRIPVRRAPAGAPFAAAARRRLREERAPLFAVLDAAKDPRIPLLLHEAGEQTASLYAGFQGAVLADVGPTLVELPVGSRLLDTLVDNGWGESWGVFLTSSHPFSEVRKHLRRFLLIESGAGKQLYFRFYDPRVLRGFLPSCPPRQVDALFEAVESFSMEADSPGSLLRFTSQGGRAIKQESPLDRGF